MEKLKKSFFSFLRNNRGETINGDPGPEPNPKDGGDGGVVTDPIVEPTIDWEGDENPYKKRYGDSQSQIQPLVSTLQQFAEYDQNTKTWIQKPQAKPEPVEGNSFDGYDPDFVKALEGYTQKTIDTAISKMREDSISKQKYDSDTLDSRSRSIEEFGGEFEFAKNGQMNQESPLYKMADEILTKKYVELNPDGTFHKYTNTDAEYLATAEAYALLSKRGKQVPPDKEKLNAIQGKGTKSAGVKQNLSYEDYRKLSSDEQDAYDMAQIGG